MARELEFHLKRWDTRETAFRLTEDELRVYLAHEPFDSLVVVKPTAHFDGVPSEFGLFRCPVTEAVTLHRIMAGSRSYGTELYQVIAHYPFLSRDWFRAMFLNND